MNNATATTAATTMPATLGRNRLGVADIVFFVVAAAAPLGATLGAGPVLFSIGGAAAPGLFLITFVVLLLFAVGLAAMSRYVISAGGFAEIVRQGLGHRAGHAAAGVAMIAYTAMLCGIYGQMAGFASEALGNFGLHVNWKLIVLLTLVVIGLLGYLHVNLSAKILGTLMMLEVLILLAFDVAVLIQVPPANFSFSGLVPPALDAPGFGVALMFAFACFIGFESTTIYGEEARSPEKTVARATYVALILIAVFYLFTMWCIGLAYGADTVQQAASDDLVNFVFAVNTRYMGEQATALMQVLALTSIFAVLLSFHNVLSRYFFALARSGFLPRGLSRVHPHHQSPARASLALSGWCLLVVGLFILFDADPIAHLFMMNVGLGVLSVLVLQMLGAFAIAGWFGKRGQGDEVSLLRGRVAPALGGVGLLVIVALAVVNFGDLSGLSDDGGGFARYLPLLVVLAAVLGWVNGTLRGDTLWGKTHEKTTAKMNEKTAPALSGTAAGQ